MKASGSPAQLTIFYAGTVNVYDDISPEKVSSLSMTEKYLCWLFILLEICGELKISFGNFIQAQAIMFMAGKSSSIACNMLQSKCQVQPPSSKSIATDVSPAKHGATTPPCSRLSSPLSVSSQTGAQSGSGSTSTEEIVATKTTEVATTPVSKLDTQKLTSAIGSVAATTLMPSGMNFYPGRLLSDICTP